GYTDELAVRYTNDALVHRTAQIANDGSQKLPQRIVAAALHRLRAGAGADHLALSIAAWIRAAEERGRSLPADLFTDPLDAKLTAIGASCKPVRESVAAIFAAAGFALDSVHRMRLEALAATHLGTLREGKGIAG